MRKIITILGIGLLIFSGCSSKNEIQEFSCQIDGVNAPEWICKNSDTDKMITGVGSAEITPLGFDFQKTEAVAAARDVIARKISVRVKNIFKRYESATGTGKNKSVEKVVENVSKQLSYQTLKNSKLLKLWKSPKGTLYVLVGMGKKDIINNIKSSLKNQIINNKAQKEWKDLDKEIEKEFN